MWMLALNSAFQCSFCKKLKLVASLATTLDCCFPLGSLKTACPSNIITMSILSIHLHHRKKVHNLKLEVRFRVAARAGQLLWSRLATLSTWKTKSGTQTGAMSSNTLVSQTTSTTVFSWRIPLMGRTLSLARLSSPINKSSASNSLSRMEKFSKRSLMTWIDQISRQT